VEDGAVNINLFAVVATALAWFRTIFIAPQHTGATTAMERARYNVRLARGRASYSAQSARERNT
jgi:hypothetical protein